MSTLQALWPSEPRWRHRDRSTDVQAHRRNRHRDENGDEPICAVLPIAPSTYYECKAREGDDGLCAPRERRDRQLGEDTRHVWEENFPVYGVRKV